MACSVMKSKHAFLLRESGCNPPTNMWLHGVSSFVAPSPAVDAAVPSCGDGVWYCRRNSARAYMSKASCRHRCCARLTSRGNAKTLTRRRRIGVGYCPLAGAGVPRPTVGAADSVRYNMANQYRIGRRRSPYLFPTNHPATIMRMLCAGWQNA